jgi:IS30 family transposase
VTVAIKRDKHGRFVRKSLAQRIMELNARGLRNSEIAHQLGIRPQNVHRALHRGPVHRVRVDWSPERLAEAVKGECDDLCQAAHSNLCECPCGGKNHGVLVAH